MKLEIGNYCICLIQRIKITYISRGKQSYWVLIKGVSGHTINWLQVQDSWENKDMYSIINGFQYFRPVVFQRQIKEDNPLLYISYCTKTSLRTKIWFIGWSDTIRIVKFTINLKYIAFLEGSMRRNEIYLTKCIFYHVRN